MFLIFLLKNKDFSCNIIERGAWSVEKMKLIIKLVLIFCSFLFLKGGSLQAQSNDDVAIILKSKGKVKVQKEKIKDWHDGIRGFRLDSGDIVKTYEQSLAAVMFTDDKSLLKVRDNSTLAIRGKRGNKTISKRITFTLGNFWIKVSKQKSKLVIETPSGIAAVKGTEFYGVVDGDGNAMIIVIEGIVQLINKLGDALVKAGQTGKLIKGKPPEVFPTDPKTTLNWAEEDKSTNELQFEFEDSDGNKKNLKINYR